MKFLLVSILVILSVGCSSKENIDQITPEKQITNAKEALRTL